jgi:hypothetical protein
MNTFSLAVLMFLIISGAFVLGISLGYWTICGILHFFNPARVHSKRDRTPVLAPTLSGD